jgi:hypothetical protein
MFIFNNDWIYIKLQCVWCSKIILYTLGSYGTVIVKVNKWWRQSVEIACEYTVPQSLR